MLMVDGTAALKTWTTLSDRETVERTISALGSRGITAYYTETSAEAKKKMYDLIPEGSEIMSMTSTTLETTGISKEIMEGGRYVPIKKKLISMDRKTQNREMQMMGAAPAWAIGSVHAITQNGELMWASQTGSQLSAYAYGADHVVWIAGTHKIVADKDEGMHRIYDHCLPLEDARARKVYGVGSAVNKMLIINKEIAKDRLHLILVNEVLGF